MKTAHEILDINPGDFGPLSREQILELCGHGMIDPYVDRKIRYYANGDPLISYGLAEAGYDIRLGYNFKIPIGKMDPKNPHYKSTKHRRGFDLPGNSFILGESIEKFDIPVDVQIKAISKSTNLRVGVLAPISPLEPGWKGRLTLEVANLGREEAVLYPGEGIAQLTFELIKPTAGYRGPYQNQRGVTESLIGNRKVSK